MRTKASKERRGRSSAAADIVLNIPSRLKHLTAPIEKLIDAVEARVAQLGRDGRAGAVSFVQRFDSALRLNVHLHVLWLDGVYGWEPGRGEPEFHVQPEVLDADVQQLVQRIRNRVGL